MTRTINFFLPLLTVMICASVGIKAQAPATKTVEQQYKNIQVLQGLPATELDPTMAFISGSLGVTCDYCHVAAYEKDDKEHKIAARKMIKMEFDINKASFNGNTEVTCNTCHRGKSRPVAVPAVAQNLFGPAPPRPAQPQLPTPDSIFEKYVQALGGAAAWDKITSRVTKGSRIGADNVLVPEDVYQKAPNKIVTTTTYPGNAFSNGFNGTTAWGFSSKDGEQQLPAAFLKQLKDDADFEKPLHLKSQFGNLRVVGQEKVNDRPAWVVVATKEDRQRERLFFDTETGLLMRRYVESKTILGNLPLQTDYDDYRDVDGVKLPFLIHWSFPGRIWGRKITEIKQNVAIEDAKFELPQKQP